MAEINFPNNPTEGTTHTGTTGKRWIFGGGAWVALGGTIEIISVPSGTVIPFASASVPSGYLYCNGQAVSRTTYSELFTAIGTTYGAGNGTTTFNLPDLRSRAIIGADDSSNRISGGKANSMGATMGAELHRLTIAELPSHSHSATTNSRGSHGHSGSTGNGGRHTHSGSARANGAHSHTFAWNKQRQGAGLGSNMDRLRPGGATATSRIGNHQHALAINNSNEHSHPLSITANGNHTHTVTVTAVGSGASHNNMQPSLVMRWMIKD